MSEAREATGFPFHTRTRRVFRFVVWYKRRHDGVAPSIRDIMRACNISSTSLTLYHLHRLENMGMLMLPAKISRGIQVTGGDWSIDDDFSIPAIDGEDAVGDERKWKRMFESGWGAGGYLSEYGGPDG